MKTTRNKNRSAMALGLVVSCMVIIFITSVGLLAVGMNTRIFAARDFQNIAAKCAADAGLVQALYTANMALPGLNDSNLPRITTATPLLGGSEQKYTYDMSGAWPSYMVNSVGTCLNSQRTVHAVIRAKSPFESAIITRDNLNFGKKIEVVGYRNGVEDPSIKVSVGVLSPTGVVSGSGTVNGTIFVGPGNTTANISSNLSGDKQVMLDPVELPPVTVPSWLSDASHYHSGDLTVGSADLTSANSGSYDDIIFSKGTLTISGNVVLNIRGNIGSASLNQGQIFIKSGSSLTIYVAGNVQAKNGIEITNATDDPSKFKLFGTGTNQIISMKNNATIFGAIYAPEANVTIKNGADMYGSVIAKSLTAEVNTTFYYDPAVATYVKTDPGMTLVVKSWYE